MSLPLKKKNAVHSVPKSQRRGRIQKGPNSKRAPKSRRRANTVGRGGSGHERSTSKRVGREPPNGETKTANESASTTRPTALDKRGTRSNTATPTNRSDNPAVTASHTSSTTAHRKQAKYAASATFGNPSHATTNSQATGTDSGRIAWTALLSTDREGPNR